MPSPVRRLFTRRAGLRRYRTRHFLSACKDRTFYVGGATDFELVEPIVAHSKYIVEKHFAGGVQRPS